MHDETVQRLNVDERGELLGEFTSEDRLLLINQSGIVKTVIPDLSLRFDDDLIVLEKWIPKKPISAIYWEGDKQLFYVKRFLIDNADKEESIITNHPKSYLEHVFTHYKPMAEVVYVKERGKDRKDNLTINLEDFISIKGISAMGNQLTKEKVLEINELEPLPYTPPKPLPAAEIEVVEEVDVTEEIENKINDVSPKDDEKGKDSPNVNGTGQTLLF